MIFPPLSKKWLRTGRGMVSTERAARLASHPMTVANHRLLLSCILMGAFTQLHAQNLYSCTDAKGRRYTSDRPIPECLDREQREHSASTGAVRRVLPPSMTADEREAFERKQQLRLAEEARKQEEKRRDRALFSRYPARAAHDKDRNEAVKTVQQATDVALIRIKQLEAERAKINDEMEFYRKDPGKAPAQLRQRVNDNQDAIRVQRRFVDSQQEEIQRIHQRFNEEATRLQPLWAANVPVTKPASPAATR